ncbi:hemerythrin domain-containing protein [Streptomyces rapamycinicus]|uniref:Hemerythrin n=2 Tax=Streptomyces rapamycinicus TaxID=1226757 RepID=A0A3L8R2D9_STRRN|nr:hemerythrin domain-containing protein [Streptomyces rapamycinicus]MBB4781698.1 hemerythrin superfamily protein [Streptomyces rapamycinicus]RLV73660.1 hemerythrin [Streptomyces rapamycinicus NRRL 5491]UTO62274.1 hemerythrin domain-containing protein [Streptomyces rapamycinicus]UTP30229.1 hemerythrin domain-containing protein [Streptomyces rapamycinicus NRRL 5491]
MTATPEQHDVVALLTADHRVVHDLFEGYRTTTDPERRRQLVDRMTVEVVRHSVAEEVHLYPTVRKALPKGDRIADEEIEELAEAERILADLDAVDPRDRRFDPLVRELMDVVSMHIRGEEDLVFPELRERLTPEERMALGLRVGEAAAAVRGAPPVSPEGPGPGRTLADRVREQLTGRTR